MTKSSRTFPYVLDAYLSRRRFLQRGGLSFAALASAACSPLGVSTRPLQVPSHGNLSFEELAQGLDPYFAVARGYQSQVLIRWGDPLFRDAPDFDPNRQSADSQALQFGYNNDYVGFLPLPYGSQNADHGLLVVNHEFTIPEMMFPGAPQEHKLNIAQMQTDIVAHGMSVVEVRREGGVWQYLRESPYNRRITPNTPFAMTGPAAGHARLKSLVSPDGVHTLGTYANCAGGITPWGTVLSGEENTDGYYFGDPEATAEAENYARYHMQANVKHWGRHIARWNLQKNPREPLHAGWIVEIDPYDPNAVPKKRTALGRFKHEGANIHINSDGRVVAYSGDDEQFEYIYRFISDRRYRPNDRAHNMKLLDSGQLSVAKFHDDGQLEWLPLEFGQGPLVPTNGFHSQADVCLDTRKAADLMGATPMDRPEDVDIHPGNGRVYAMLTNNTARSTAQVDAANPRAQNGHGQIIEFWPEDGDHSRKRFRWDLFLLAGDPAATVTSYHPNTSVNGWLSCPDNCTFDRLGNLWIATDGAFKAGVADGVWATEVDGPYRALTKRFLRVPIGAELCGPCFTPDDRNFFCAVQHPAEGSNFESPSTRWPDFLPHMPPRPSVVVIRHQQGERIGV